MTNLPEIAETSYPCSKCGASAGAKCRTLSSGLQTMPHAARLGPLEDVFLRGYREGRASALHYAAYIRDRN